MAAPTAKQADGVVVSQRLRMDTTSNPATSRRRSEGRSLMPQNQLHRVVGLVNLGRLPTDIKAVQNVFCSVQYTVVVVLQFSLVYMTFNIQRNTHIKNAYKITERDRINFRSIKMQIYNITVSNDRI